FWKPISFDEDGNTIRIEQNDFYIIRSKERLCLPGDIAVYGQAMTESLGELRIHYAGFAHPYFGFYREEGTPLIFEIRGHNVDTFLRDNERIARIKYYRMSEKVELTDEEKKHEEQDEYQNQELFLSKYFKKWE
ncbi:MAG: 2'-deoxycytidine 5'-triphosphate deaminase, partial [Candidatus Hatepunaea meridiana]|nr:2'-deoxycytidine 5'-triphosphate deaminase [Candidatus Hatepunaea meridiana]